MFKPLFTIPRSVLARRLINRIIIAASVLMVLTLFTTGFLTWRYEQKELENRFNEIEKGTVNILRSALWENDAEYIELILMTLSRLPGIQSVHIHEKDGIRFTAGEKKNREATARRFPMRHTYNGKSYELGEFHLEVDSDYIARKVMGEVLVIALSQAIMILLVSLLVFVLVYRSFIQRLLAIQRHTASLSPESLSEPMTAIGERWGPDELDDLRNSINHMQKDLQTSFAVQTSLSERLKRHEKELEETVRQKTASLHKANEKLKLAIAQKEALQAEREKIIEDLEHALHEVRQLSGMLPICVQCKKIRDDSGYWKRLETYITEHSEAVFTHSICPDCAKELYPDLDLEERSSSIRED